MDSRRATSKESSFARKRERDGKFTTEAKNVKLFQLSEIQSVLSCSCRFTGLRVHEKRLITVLEQLSLKEMRLI